MAKKRLVLMASKCMDKNKKDGRNEHSLIRMSSTARDSMGFHNDKVELWPADPTGEDRLNRSIMLTVFHAFKDDLSELKAEIQSGKMAEEKYNRIGFVTTKTFNRICGAGNKKGMSENIWISNDIYDTVIGTDPEFLFFHKTEDTIVSAVGVLPHVGEMGCDGAMAEIRPKPEVSVERHVKNMEAIFDAHKDEKKLKDLRWHAACYHEDDYRGYPVGGHIHIGNPRQLVNQSDTVRQKFYKVANKIIDEYITLALVKLDGEPGSRRRKKDALYSGFGGFGDFRTEHGRLEHRSMSGIWLLHPSLTKAVLGSTKAVTDEIFRHIAENKFKGAYILPGNRSKETLYSDNFDGWDEIPLAHDMECPTSSAEMKKVLLASDPKYMTATRIKNLHSKFKKLSTYNENSIYIEAFCEILKLSFEEISEWDKDIKKNWLGKKKFLVNI
jgi:hypothetical protein